MNRRDVLGATAVLGSGSLGGCLFAGSGDGCSFDLPAQGFVIRNVDDTAHTLSITATRELIVHTKEVFSESYELGSAESDDSTVEVPDAVDIAGPHILELELENGASTTYLWEVTTDRCDALNIEVRNGEVSVSEVGGQ